MHNSSVGRRWNTTGSQRKSTHCLIGQNLNSEWYFARVEHLLNVHLPRSIKYIENDITAIRTEHDAQNRIIQAQKSSLINIISDLGSLRLMGKEADTPREGTPVPTGEVDIPPSSPLPEREEGEEGESTDEQPLSASLNPKANPFVPSGSSVPTLKSIHGRKNGSTPTTAASSRAGSKAVDDDDVEMGELAEEPRGKKNREELEEGEASDISSVLSELPED